MSKSDAKFVPLPLEKVSEINQTLISNLLKNSSHRLLSERDNGQVYFIFTVPNEDESSGFNIGNTDDTYSYKELASRVQANLSEQKRLADEAQNTDLSASIPYLGAKKIKVTYLGANAELVDARLISVKNGWTMVGNIAYQTSNQGAIIKTITLNKRKPETEGKTTTNQEVTRKVVEGI